VRHDLVQHLPLDRSSSPPRPLSTCRGIVRLTCSSLLSLLQDGPHYGPGCLINVGLTAFGIVVSVLNVFLLKAANKRKQAVIDSGAAAKLSKQELADLGDESPYFKYTI
jgi:hypothetical protein